LLKVAVKIYQGSGVTQTVLSGLTIYPLVQLQISYSVNVPKVMKVGWQ